MARIVRLASTETEAMHQTMSQRCARCEGRMAPCLPWDHDGKKPVLDGTYDWIVYAKCTVCGHTDFFLFKTKARTFTVAAVNAASQLLVSQDGEIWLVECPAREADPKPGNEMLVPILAGRPDFAAVGLTNPRYAGQVRPEMIPALMGLTLPVSVEEVAGVLM